MVPCMIKHYDKTYLKQLRFELIDNDLDCFVYYTEAKNYVQIWKKSSKAQITHLKHALLLFK